MPNQGGKGNPASHRMSNPKRKSRREASWARSQARKAKNRAENEARAKANAERRKAGLPIEAVVRRREYNDRRNRAVEQEERKSA